MIDAYLIVAGVLVMVTSYIMTIHYLLSHVERRDLAALTDGPQLKRPPAKAKPVSSHSPDVLPARA